jgi:hypothetical protein
MQIAYHIPTAGYTYEYNIHPQKYQASMIPVNVPPLYD